MIRLVLALSWLGGGRAQIYHFESAAIPNNKSLHVLYTYYIYSHEDAPESNQRPFVKFHGLNSHSSVADQSDVSLKDYRGVQLSIMRYDDFWNLIDPKKFCCGWEDVEKKKCPHRDELLVQKPVYESLTDENVYLYTVRFPNATNAKPRDKRMEVHKTGVYILVFSNCGDLRDAMVSGSVLVKNPYGFLPGIEYHKMPFYGWLCVVYMVLALFWMLLSLRWWKELFNIQNCISVVIFFGLLESFLWFIYYNDWNTAGVRGKFLFVLGVLASVVKSIFSYMLVLVASLGWGVTRPYLDKTVTLKIQAVCFVYIILDVVREVVLSFRHSHSLSIVFVLLCLLPVSALNGAIFYWVFTALSSLIQTLKERNQSQKLALFQRLWKILIFTLSVATVTLLYQIFTFAQSISERWMYQWLFTDGVSHILFLLVLAAMMYLWAPHKYSQRYAYSQQIGDDEDNVAGGGPSTWADEGIDDDDDDGLQGTKLGKSAFGDDGDGADHTL